MSFYSPNLRITENIKSTLFAGFQTLRRVSFAVDTSFSFGTFTPLVTWDGMTASSITLSRLRFIKLYKLYLFSIDISATLAAPFGSDIVVPLPVNAVGEAVVQNAQSGGGSVLNAGVVEPGRWVIYDGTNKLLLQRMTGANYSAGSFRFSANGFIEVA